jgi:putative transposase
MADQMDGAVRKGSALCVANPLPYWRSGEIPEALLDESVTRIIQETAAEIAERFPIEMEAIGTDQNHIPLLCRAHPKMVPGRIVQILKSITAREIFRRKPAVKRGTVLSVIGKAYAGDFALSWPTTR